MSRVYYTIQDWRQVPAELEWLTAGERLRLDGFRFEKRRRDWLLGRWTAKIALLGIANMPRFEIGRFEIASAPDGAPLPLLEGKPYKAGLSLSHSDGRAFCAVAADTMTLGCDIELVEARSTRFVETFFTASEGERIASTDPQFRDSLITMIWSAKESALKALRHGLSADTRSVEVVTVGEHADADWGTAEVVASDAGSFSCWWRVDDPWILSVVARAPVGMPVALEPGLLTVVKRTPVSTGCGALRQ